jgi:4-diphosphocytidyl-2-C-methyl-D-erythritol kinase
MKEPERHSVTISANAKINLFLRVGELRSDGYHDIETVFHSVSLADTVRASLAGEGLSVACDDPSVPLDSTNLALRAAASALDISPAGREAAERVPGIRIEITKRIPVGAGLGGGSADAAATLVAVNALCGLGLGPCELEAKASALGADVRFMLRGGCAVGRGRGDLLEALVPAAGVPVVIVAPRVTVSTAWAYESLRIRLTRAEPPLTMIAGAVERRDVRALGGLLENDFESLVFERFPEIRRIRDEMIRLGAAGALLSGSGSSVYGLFLDACDAAISGEALLGRGLRVYVADLAVRGVTTTL